MNEYSIYVSNGKVIGDSIFFLRANESLSKECTRLCDFTQTFDKTPLEKKANIAEYKCAKYRYAEVSTVHAQLEMNHFHRKQHNLEYSNYVIQFFSDKLKERHDYFSLYVSAPENEKPDYSLYYALLTMAENEIAKHQEKIVNATDWEKVELEERIGGLSFAIECLNEAWEKRKDVIA